MFNLFQNIHIDWLGKRKIFIAFSIFIMLVGPGLDDRTAIYAGRHGCL